MMMVEKRMVLLQAKVCERLQEELLELFKMAHEFRRAPAVTCLASVCLASD